MEYTWYSGSRHRAACTVCAKAFYENCNVSVTYTGNGSTSHTHTLGCDECGHITGTANTACTLSFVFAGTVNGSNTHHYVCTVCGHKAASYSPCVYKNGNTCFACGTSKDVTGTTATGEMESAE